ncbi:Putative uncharacterized protein [Taphrina deformans PYCC 5710]|uniref:Protein PNS1 n=1 Tax=Taphrina deformans (strain PYCC 5710 / ATCC 11124 / CBS 356.35 / IMI 108563 / JCM 9778 / NBRC 8474) TaxID=1097556 RepID=R4XFI9_TAPDE|nr:Putative uncharacterized protein [Taphrina deformans PYCC 5710]|eukprot:CCG83242.1 Putative uncharacterized protein [Taphrina deformans PYCC 5710]
MALRQSRAGLGSRFGIFPPIEDSDEHERDEDSDHEAMKSSWVPPEYRRNRERQAATLETAPVEISASKESIEAYHERTLHDGDTGAYDSDAGSEHNEPPMDIAFETQPEDSIPPRSLAGSFEAPNRLAASDDSITQDTADSSEANVPLALLEPQIASVQHDRAYALLFMACQASIFATSLFVFLTTDTKTTPVADTIYSALTSAIGLISRDTIIALAISGIWLVALKSFVRPLLQTIIIVVPIVIFSLSSYILSWSYRGSLGGYEVQARAMRWSSLCMLCFAFMWIYSAWKGRHTMMKTISIIKLACTILEQNYPLLLLGIGSLATVIFYSFIWLHQFERIFLRGTFEGLGTARHWLMNGSSWFIGGYFVWMFLWTFAVISGIQRSTTSAAVSHWYFHRHDLPKANQMDVAKAALLHSLSTSFGSICASALLSLLSRLPLVVLPRRVSGLLSMVAYVLISAPLQGLMSPLTLSYASIHSLDLGSASRSISQHPILNPNNSWTAYRTAKMLLSAARATTALGLGVAAWISSARAPGGNATVYGYMVGLVAGAIGWAVVGSIEGVVSMIVDATFVCYGTDLPRAREGRSHCLDATNAFGSGRSTTLGALHV